MVLQMLKPETFPTVPRLLSRLYDNVHSKLATSGAISKLIFRLAYNYKLFLLNRGIVTRKTIFDKLVFGSVIVDG